jgi:hypothetical protein
VLLDERVQGPFRLGPDRHRDPGRNQVEHDDRRAVVRRDGIGEAHRELGVGATAYRHEHAPDLTRATLLDDRDVAGGFARDLVDGRGEDGRAAVATIVARGRLAAPTEDDEVGLLLGCGLGDALRRMPADADHGLDRRARRGVVEHFLEQPPGMPRAGRALGQRHPLWDLDDSQR